MATEATPQPVPVLPALDRPAIIAEELKLGAAAVARTLALIDEGATVPFLARYRKEVTGGMDEVQLQAVKERAEALAELESRRRTVVASIAEQGKLTDELLARIAAARTRTVLEDLYLPYRPRRRTRAMMARERGLEPLADRLWAQEATGTREAMAMPFVSADKGVADVEAAWSGARDIVAERISDTAEARVVLRALTLEQGILRAQAVGEGNEPERLKYKDYFQFAEPASKVPSHRTLALRRAEKEGFLRVALEVDRDACLERLRRLFV
jgi:uncharacterized protein